MNTPSKRRQTFAATAALFVFALNQQISAQGQNEPAVPELNRKTLNFALAHLGQQVGDGQCSSLAAAALQAAGARLARGFVFGRELGPNEPWLPGDIIQFTNCVFDDRHGAHWQVGTPTHTSIICSARDRVTVLVHQNSNHDLRAQQQTLDFADLVSGTYKVYRPVNDAPPGTPQANLATTSPTNNLFNIMQHPVVDGPLREARSAILERIRTLQSQGVNTYRYRHKFQGIEMVAGTMPNDASDETTNALAEAVNGLCRQLSIRGTR